MHLFYKYTISTHPGEIKVAKDKATTQGQGKVECSILSASVGDQLLAPKYAWKDDEFNVPAQAAETVIFKTHYVPLSL